MAELDARLAERLQTFLASLTEPVAGGPRTLADFVRPGLAEEIRTFLTEVEPVLGDVDPGPDAHAEADRAEAVLAETYRRAQELSYLLLCATVRRPELRESLRPRVGVTADEHAHHLGDMRQRVTGHEGELRVGDARLVLPTHLSEKAISDQLHEHMVASLQLARRRGAGSIPPDRRDSLRRRGSALQRQVNGVLEMLFPEDRAAQTRFGLSSRSQQRRR